ncbi:uncharacterized protein RSE6_05232 [Rhynchosporium secalis]|uniref:Uncharacterized protein n=1 Tax=Rhynchosporium secalis TaxID=38038 RepID=A0A1E1M798_RHYSE|nr:uncharacterized protein RSE6_05232 [Rhynchosporium secalis]
MSRRVPQEAVAVYIVVLFYSTMCLTLSTLLTSLLIQFGEAWSYVTIVSGFTCISTLASVGQQIHYAVSWEIIKIAQFEKAVESQLRKGTSIGGGAQIVDQWLFFIQFYCYNVMSLSVFFWSVALFIGAWGIRSAWLGDWYDRIAPISKIFAVVFPAAVIGIMQIEALQRITELFILVTYVSIFTSLSLGSILLVLILYKYMKTRRLVAGPAARRGRWWASNGSKSRSNDDSGYAAGTVETGVSSGGGPNTRRSIYDRALVTRFSIGFVVLAVFEIVIIISSLFTSRSNAALAASGKPDFSIRSAITDITLFLPGATASLVSFLVFGTTKSWRQYRDLVIGGCGLTRRIIRKKQQRAEEATRTQGLEFERLPSLKKSASEEERKAISESENRIRMFAREMGRDRDSIDGDFAGFTPENQPPPAIHLRTPSNSSRVPHFRRPMPSASSTYGNKSLNVIEIGISIDQTVHYETPSASQNKNSQAQESSGSDDVIEIDPVPPHGRRNLIWPENLHK